MLNLLFPPDVFCQPYTLWFLSSVVKDVVIIGQPNHAVQLQTPQPSDTQAAGQMEGGLGESICRLKRLDLNVNTFLIILLQDWRSLFYNWGSHKAPFSC